MNPDAERDETEHLLRESARALLERGGGEAAWTRMVEAGWTELTDPVLLGVILSELGRACIPSPYLQSAAAGVILERHAPESHALRSRIRTGERVSVVTRTGAGAHPVEWAAGALTFLVAVREGTGGESLYEVPSASARVTPAAAMDDEEIALVEVAQSSGTRLDSTGADLVEPVRAVLALLRAAEIIGGCRRVLEMTVSHVRDRYQFGRPLASLQVVQHRCADAAIAVDAAEVTTREALALLAAGAAWRRAALIAARVASRAFVDVTVAASQLHGGVGYITEHPLHRYFRHAKAQQLRLGVLSELQEAISREPWESRRWWDSRSGTAGS
jgi:alkylation response protein AidB-like acyl-CoA dehydrogenase